MLEMSSPGRYCRYSANSTLKPLNGLRCRPERKPSTTVLAFSSSVPRRATTAGSRNRSSPGRATLAMMPPRNEYARCLDETAFRGGHRLEQLGHDAVGREPLGLG